jgi:hypothetical protein
LSWTDLFGSGKQIEAHDRDNSARDTPIVRHILCVKQNFGRFRFSIPLRLQRSFRPAELPKFAIKKWIGNRHLLTDGSHSEVPRAPGGARGSHFSRPRAQEREPVHFHGCVLSNCEDAR